MGEFCKESTMPSEYVLCTGGRGFIGSHAIAAMAKRGYGGCSYDRLDGEEITNFKQLEKKVKLVKPRWIIHLAGQTCLAPALADPQNDATLNIIGSLNVLELARKYDCGVTFSSSGAIYGNNYQYPEPLSPYGVSKLAVENYCKLYNKLYGLHTVVFRFSSVYGIGRAPTSINLILQKALNGEVIKITGDGNQTRDFTYVKDVAEALAMSAEGTFPHDVYDIGTGTATSLNQLILLLSTLIGRKIEIEYVPESIGDPKRNELNVSKIAMYGWKAKTTLAEGLREMIDVMKK